MRAANRR